MASKPKYNPDDVERWVTVRGARIPIMKDGSFGVGTKESSVSSDTIKKKMYNVNSAVQQAREAKDWKTYEEATKEYNRLSNILKETQESEKTVSRNARYDTSRAKNNRAKNDEDLWMNHMTPAERNRVMASLSDPAIKQAVVDNRMHGEKMESVFGKIHRQFQAGKTTFRQLPKNVRNLKKGEYFTKKDLSDPKESQVWVRGEYIPSAKAYSCYKFSDISQETLLKSSDEVYTDFYF